MPSQWEDGAGVQAQLLSPLPRRTAARLASCCPLHYQQKITALPEKIATFSASPLHERSNLSSLRRHSWPPASSPPHSTPSPPDSGPAHLCQTLLVHVLSAHGRHPFPFSTGQALTYPSSLRPHGTASGKPSFTFRGNAHWITLLPTLCVRFPRKLPSARSEHVPGDLAGPESAA